MRQRFALLAASIALFCAMAFVQHLAGEPSEWEHRRADAVLFPRFVAAMNDWSGQHDMSEPDHYRKLDAADRKRLNAARAAWREFDEAMRRAGN